MTSVYCKFRERPRNAGDPTRIDGNSATHLRETTHHGDADRPGQDAEVHDTFPINGTDYLEFYVGNAKQAANFYQSAFGFQLVAYRGPETGVRDRTSYLLTQNKIRLVLDIGARAGRRDRRTTLHRHGDGVRDIALWVDDARDAYAKAMERGAKSALRAAGGARRTMAR